MKYLIRIPGFILICASICMLHSCKKFVDIPDSKTQITTPTVFSDSVGATSAILGVYSNIMSSSAISGPLNGYITLYMGLASDELKATAANSNEQQFYKNALSASSGYRNFWDLDYIYIYQVNACIEGLQNSVGISNAYKNQLLGEAKFSRAFIYFQLVNLYGGVPLITSTDYHVNASKPRASVDSVYNLIINDLTDAKNLMTENYPTSGRVRPNKYAAIALLGKVYLFRREWAKAEDAASQVIGSGIYSLENDLNHVFLAGSNEAIWQLLPIFPGFETQEGLAFNPVLVTLRPKYIISDFLFNSFEANDLRKTKWINNNTVRGVTYYYPYKYKLGRDNNTAPVENYTIFRLADQYLIRSEARAQLGNQTDAESDLNLVRERAGLTDTTAAGQDDLLDIIYHERRVEMFVEWGNRWFDLKRTGNVDAVMSVVTPAKGGTWDTNSQLCPVPRGQINLNPFLTQNPGY